jgi:glucan phosphoethanolaminetransferase (alkaline phosphatase superfamily)
VWEQFRTGQLTESEVWNLYLDNLRYVLDEVELLLRNFEAESVVISSDHGNAFGEFGIYGHPPGMPFKSIRKVPWYVTSATDTKEYIPETVLSVDETKPEIVDQRLRDLGYL